MFTHLYQRQHFKEAEVRVYGGEIVLALEHLHKVGEDLGLLRALGLGLVLGHPTGQPGCALSWVVLVGAGVAFPGLLEGKALVLPGEGSLPSPPSARPPYPRPVPPQRGFPLTGNLGLLPGPHSTELPQMETSCLGSQGLAMGLFTQALLLLGPSGLFPGGPPSLLLCRKWLFHLMARCLGLVLHWRSLL